MKLVRRFGLTVLLVSAISVSAATTAKKKSAPAAPTAPATTVASVDTASVSEPETRPLTLKELEPKARYSFSGLRFVLVKETDGPRPQKGDLLTVHYSGTLADGTPFDSSRNGSPFKFKVGMGQVIKGWDEGLMNMRKGERWILIVPPELGYGAAGSGPIPPNATLIFDVELLDF